MIDFKYRPDVDGLRAVAVILVLLFHADLGFSGGFIGVDVFFVISGFLITGLILKEQDADKFSLANFWVRRILRIIPAATVMVVAVLVAGFFLLLPRDYVDLGKSTIAQQLMLSNVYFWRNTAYFDVDVHFDDSYAQREAARRLFSRVGADKRQRNRHAFVRDAKIDIAHRPIVIQAQKKSVMRIQRVHRLDLGNLP